MQYKVRDRVKVISLEKVHERKKDFSGDYVFPANHWISEYMDKWAGTIQQIDKIDLIEKEIYFLDTGGWVFTEDMIEGYAVEPLTMKDTIYYGFGEADMRAAACAGRGNFEEGATTFDEEKFKTWLEKYKQQKVSELQIIGTL